MLTPLPLVVQKMPIQKALTSGNGNIKFYRESTRSNLKIIPDHKNAIQVYSLFADPPPFSLPSTFKSMLNSIDNQPTYSEKSGLSRWCWQGAGFRGAGAHQLVNMPEKKIKTERLLFYVNLFVPPPPPLRRPLSSIRFP
jgi:hypothetical protein